MLTPSPLKRAIVCFANIQEGRDVQLIRDLANAASSIPGASLLRIFSDRSFHRSGFCIAGEDEAVGSAVIKIAALATNRIDLSKPEHGGNHHHIGAVDLLPFHPLGTATLQEAAAVAQRVAAELGAKHRVSVLTYGAAHPSGRTLVELRKQTSFFRRGQHGQAKVETGVAPDYGPAEPSEGAGLTVCGATPYVLNYNLMLDTADVGIAKDICKHIRASMAGGIPGVEAMAYLKGTAQQGEYLAEVACNLREAGSIAGSTDAVSDRVQEMAKERGAKVSSSYTTNPTLTELDAWREGVGAERNPAFDWRVPPGDFPML